MILSLAERRTELSELELAMLHTNKTLDLTLRRAPVWYRPGMSIDNLSPRMKEVAMKLEADHSQLKTLQKKLNRIRREIRLIDIRPVDLEKAHKAALKWLNSVRDVSQFSRELKRDPMLDARPPLARFSRKLVSAILKYRDRQGRQGVKDLRDLLQIRGVTINHIAHILYTGLQIILQSAPRPPQKPMIGVMLPVRLETRFDAPSAGRPNWHMRLRVIPDEPWFDRHDPVPETSELDSLEDLWNLVGSDGLDSDKGSIAWQSFVKRHGGGRAAWLARTFPPKPPNGSSSYPLTIDRPTTVRDNAIFSQIRDFPNKLEVWIKRQGQAIKRVAVLLVLSNQLKLEPADPTNPSDSRWWSSFTEAVRVGLAADIDIGMSTPSDIEAIFVVGLGSQSPKGLFQAHRDAGRLSILSPGQATNTVDGQPAAPVNGDPDMWGDLVMTPNVGQQQAHRISRALTNQTDALTPLAGGDYDDFTPGQSMVAALWPALWGHAFKDIWRWPDVDDAGLWAGQFLNPYGPLPPIRVGNQPYGLLPTTSLALWKADQNDPAIEAKAIDELNDLRQRWVQQAEASGNVLGADTDRLLELLGRTGTSNSYAYRNMISDDVLLAILRSLDEFYAPDDLIRSWRNSAKKVLEISTEPKRRYFAMGWPKDLELALVMPTNLPEKMTFEQVVKILVGMNPGALSYPGVFKDIFKGALPNSLFVRLLIYVLVRTGADVALSAKNLPSELEPIYSDASQPLNLAFRARQMNPQDLTLSTKEAMIYRVVRDSALRLTHFPIDVLERHMKATIDTASHRIDPWITGIAWHRLDNLLDEGAKTRLGIYGWADRPFLGNPGPTTGGLLHAPSHQQAITAAILRDKAIHDPEVDRWDMDLSSDRVRKAGRLAQEVRLGAHISEALGREIERIVGSSATIDALRQQFPLREGEEGRVCDGQAVLEAQPSDLPLNTLQRTALDEIRLVLDTYGDLLVGEAVHHVVSGRADIAGAAMDAAAGLQSPPNFEFIQTPRPGRPIHNSVSIVLPLRPDPVVGPNSSPGEIADSAVADFLVQMLGAADSNNWQWQVTTPEVSVINVTLADLGLTPIDSVGLSLKELHDAILAEGPVGSTLTGGAGSRTFEIAGRLMNAIGCKPAVPSDFADQIMDDEPVRLELIQRYQWLRQAAEQLLVLLNTAIVPTASDATRKNALRFVRQWGIVPLATGLGNEFLHTQVTNARDAFQQRLDAAPAFSEVTGLTHEDLARKIAELASSEGRLCITGKVDLGGLETLTTESKNPTTGLNVLDEKWLNVVSAVREPMTRLELYQLEAALDPNLTTLAAWTNRPGDPWQTNVTADAEGNLPSTRLVAFYGPSGILDVNPAVDPTEFNVGQIDVWSETIPEIEQMTSAVFGFNAPSARAPQAVLLAAPPDVDKPLDTKTLVNILAETKALAVARAVSPADVQLYSAALPSIMLPAGAVDLKV